jgi:hypothetical protein
VGLTTLPPCVSRISENVGVSTCRKPKGLHGLYKDNFTLPYLTFTCCDSGYNIIHVILFTVLQLYGIEKFFVNLSNITFHNNPLSGSPAISCSPTEWHAVGRNKFNGRPAGLPTAPTI